MFSLPVPVSSQGQSLFQRSFINLGKKVFIYRIGCQTVHLINIVKPDEPWIWLCTQKSYNFEPNWN